MDNNLLKKYKTINLVALGLTIYFLMLPIISPIISKFFPTLWRCSYLYATGKRCPFCGITRDLDSAMHLNFSFINEISIFMFIFIIFELIFRIIIMNIKTNLKKIIVLDILIHIFVVIYLTIYVILFLNNGVG